MAWGPAFRCGRMSGGRRRGFSDLISKNEISYHEFYKEFIK